MKIVSTSLIIFLIIISCINISSENNNLEEDEPQDKDYENLLKWGKTHNLNITEKIRLIKEKDNKLYIAKNLIPEDDIIMDIPPECMLNINNSLSLLNQKKFRKGFEKYKEVEKLSIEVMKDEHHVEQAFLSYILYIVNKKKKTYEKNNFYKYYSPMFYTFDQNLDNLPFYFSSEQMRIFFNTSFGSVFEILNRYIQDEVTAFEKHVFNKTIDSEEYLKYRILTIQKSIEVNKTLNIIPFLEYIKKDFKKVNCEFSINEQDHIIIKANANIFPGEELIMRPNAISNEHRLIFFGETFEELKAKYNTFNIPSLIPNYITDKPVDFDINSLGPKSRVDLVEIDFYKGLIFVYKKFARLIDEDDSDMGACKLILRYLSRIRDNYDFISHDQIRQVYFRKKDIENVIRIVEGEKMYLEKRIDTLKTYMRNLDERNKRKINYDAEDVNDL